MEAKRRLRAYVSGALTGSGLETARALYERIAEVAEEFGFEAYVPHRSTDPIANPSVSPARVYETDRTMVLNADLVIAVLSQPSLGVGMELEIAAGGLIPVVVLAREDVSISRMALAAPSIVAIVRFRTEDDLLPRFRETLGDARERVMRLPRLALPEIRHRVATLRRDSGMNRGELARRLNLGEDAVRLLETADSAVSNPSLKLLAATAEALDVSLATLLGDIADQTPLLVSLREYAAQRGITFAAYQRLERLAARGLRADRALTRVEWERLQTETDSDNDRQPPRVRPAEQDAN